jgi:transposase
MDYCGFDLAKVSSQICLRTADGQLVERRMKTTREELSRFFSERPRTRILLEAATESEWVAQHLEGMGHEVIVGDPNFAPMYSTLSKKIKTDKRDARALCDACEKGNYRPAYRGTAARRQVRAELIARETLVATRTKYISVIRSMLRREGIRVQSCAAGYFRRHVEEMSLPEHLRAATRPLLEVLILLDEQIGQADEKLAEVATREPLIKRLCLIPGIGPVTSITFVAILGEFSRFASAKQVRAYLGLVPQEDSSGERQHRGRITKAGNSRMRSLLVEVGWLILYSKKAEVQGLKQWALRIAARRGKRVAVVALARKLAGILYALWRDGTQFDPSRMQPDRAAAMGS